MTDTEKVSYRLYLDGVDQGVLSLTEDEARAMRNGHTNQQLIRED